MGTTADQLRTGSIEAGWVLAIDGYEVLLTNRPDVSAMVAAWAGTDWTEGAGGLKIRGERSQDIDPWSVDWGQAGMTFEIVGDAFGRAANNRLSGVEADLLAEVGVTDSSVQIPATSASRFGGLEKTIFVDNERIDYGFLSGAGSFTVLTRSKYTPYQTSSGVGFRRLHRLVDQGQSPFDIRLQPIVSAAPRDWVGRWVSLYLHRIEGGVWDSQSEAMLVFSGRIASIDDTESLTTVLECVDVLSVLQDSVILRDQFRAEVRRGYFITRRGKWVIAQELFGGATVPDLQQSEPLSVAAPGFGTSAIQIEEGFYTVDEIINILNRFFRDQLGKGNLLGNWEAGLVSAGDSGEPRVSIVVHFDAGASHSDEAGVFALSASGDLLGATVNQEDVAGLLGYRGEKTKNPLLGRKISQSIFTDLNGAGRRELVAAEPPKETGVTDVQSQWGEGWDIGVTNVQGQFIDQRDYLSNTLRNEANRTDTIDESTGPWGLFDVGGVVVLGRYDDASGFIRFAKATPDLRRVFGQRRVAETGFQDVKLGSDGKIAIRQILHLQAPFSELVLGFFASSGVAGWNHPDYDVFPASLSVQMPWSILGDRFRQSLEFLEQQFPGEIGIMIREATPLSELLAPDLLVRNAQLVWRAGGLEFVCWSSESPIGATFTLDNDTKSSASPDDPHLSPARRTDEFLRNIFVFRHTPELGGEEFREIEEFRFTRSLSRYGERRVEIDLKNTYGANYPIVGNSAEDAIAWFIASVAPFFANPLNIIERTYRLKFFDDIAPGDTVLLSDPYVRDPRDGQRGIESRPAIVLGTRYSYGGEGSDMVGTLRLLFNGDERVGSWSPTAEVDDTANAGGFTSGYNAGTLTFRTQANVYSQPDNDAASFEVGDAIAVVQVDPADPAVFDLFTTTVASVVGVDVQHVGPAFGGFDPSKKYRIVSDDWGTANATQREDVYQADEASREINFSPTEMAQEYAADFRVEDVPSANSQTLPERHSDWMFGQGQPMSSSIGRSLALTVNNSIDYRMAINAPFLAVADFELAVPGDEFRTRTTRPIFFGEGRLASRFRRLYVAPLFRLHEAAVGSEAIVRVYVSRFAPIGDDVNFEGTEFDAPWGFAEFSTMSLTNVRPSPVGIDVGFALEGGVAFLTVQLKNARMTCLPVCYLGAREDT